MAVTAHEYVGMLKELLPPGPAWPRGRFNQSVRHDV